MKILMIHNEYAATSGEEVQFYSIASLLRSRGHEVELYTRSSKEIVTTKLWKVRAFFAGIYNPCSIKQIKKVTDSFKPDIAFIQNLFPFISPAVLAFLKTNKIPVLMRVANYRLMCPNGLHLRNGEVCEKCKDGREYWCFLLNCENNIFKSFGYALRSYISRVRGLYRKNISAYICASHFLHHRMVSAGFDSNKIHIIPNLIPDNIAFENLSKNTQGEYVGYAGRVSKEKGIDVLIKAACECPNIPFRIAGQISSDVTLPAPLPRNIKLLGFLEEKALHDFYSRARILLSTSICFETFGISVAEAMLHAKPVIVSHIGVFPEFVDDKVTGLLFEPGNAKDLANKIRYLWESPVLCNQLGKKARAKVLNEYSPDVYYKKLMVVFEKIIAGYENAGEKHK